jgi:hypothetical protein
MFATVRTARLRERKINPCPPGHRSLCCASLGSAAVVFRMDAEEQVEESVTSHEGPRSESLVQPPPEVGNISAKRVAERKVERYSGILGQ